MFKVESIYLFIYSISHDRLGVSITLRLSRGIRQSKILSHYLPFSSGGLEN